MMQVGEGERYCQFSDFQSLFHEITQSFTVKKTVDVPCDFWAAISATQNWGQNIAFLVVEMHIIYIL